MMLEADVNLGSLISSPSVLPIMAHPPDTTSDISFADFVKEVVEVRRISKEFYY